MQKDHLSAQHFNDSFNLGLQGIESFSFAGKKLTALQLARLSGAPDGAKFTFTNQVSGVMIEVVHPFYEHPSARRVSIDAEGYLRLWNFNLHILPQSAGGPGPGMGTRIFARQVKAARELGIPNITTYAGAKKPGKALVGYAVWPTLGFDAKIPPEMLVNLPSTLSNCTLISQLYGSAEGKKWWINQKQGCIMNFDVRETSAQSQHLSNYLTLKGVSV
ncbi:hypothetical protein [Duganella qianjiadongensis]|uniref:Uncharacterized protein n=1 Tax=Duganella qianjiadongensis TaxID=2692176 RepID=A0ABW9VSY9_9BURK|nr:hypothetical protein [Duganella qianjiadongensis]MYM42172.1 hypothetical protein [Duganella qianjiadongensis]